MRTDDVNGTRFLQYNTWVPAQCSSIQTALENSFSDVTIHVSSGTHSVSSYLTVNSGIALELNAGSSLIFSSSSRLLVYGNLTANGTSGSHVTLDGQGYSRASYAYPLVLTASGGTANIQYADFTNAAFELTTWYNSGNVSVQNCSFTNFGYSSDAKAVTIYQTSANVSLSNSTFTGSNSQGTGIYSYGTGTNVTLSGNTITYAGTGIYTYSSDAFMTSNTIYNNVNYGINANNVSSSAQYRGNDIRSSAYGLSLNSSSPWIMHNIVIQNNLNVLVNSCSPNFATLESEGDYLHGHNTIAHAGSPLLWAQYSAFPYLGYDYDGGYNSIFDSDLPDLYVTNYSGAYAANNYWTDGYPTYHADGTSWALTSDPLQSNPNPDPLAKRGFAKLAKNGLGLSAFTSNSISPETSNEDAFRTALAAAVHGEISVAATGLRSLIESGSDKFAPLSLLVYYDLGIGRWNSANDVRQVKGEMYSILENLRSEQVSSSLRPFALRLLARDAAVSRNDSVANIYRMEILKDYTKTPHELATMYDLVVYYVQAEANLQKAKDMVAKMVGSYPDENLTYMARIEVGEKVSLPGAKLPEVGSPNGQISEFALDPVYPNPFNPSTTITFRIQEASQVSLRIFDVLGREVVVLVNENRSAGSHSVIWNASNLPSGIYFSRLDAGEKSAIRKLLLVK